ncbi:HipA N-terminal domain-containing protein [uncultured Sphaerochaeta sp.]|uniref:HipA N-terminal domain-containing protein n=1 Tax=uncultured Sphaerochaeta sp. TaxID=886478 RepID=UPI0029CA232A|nr:HipA N-terminal domain-containing protein [uncultured Sphaerochaeta sp.]
MKRTRQGRVFVRNILAGIIAQTDEGYQFTYDPMYLQTPGSVPISLTMPLQEAPYQSTTFFPFFDGLIPEGWLLEQACRNWKLDRRDRMGLLLHVCRDCVGFVSVEEVL